MTDPTVLFTGFPGFLGSALLERVLERGEGPVACLVQPKYRDLAERRASEIAATVDGVDRDDAIRLYDGDVTSADLDLGDRLETLRTVEAVYHLAAVYDLGVDAAVADAVNVRGTEHVLDVAEDLGVERFHYVSTCYVSGRYDGTFTEDHLREGQAFNNHYEETKYRAEVAVQERMADGFPATVYRPAITVGDSRTGETDKFDGPYNLLRLLFAQPRWCSVVFTPVGARHAELNVVPRNVVVDAIAHLSGREDAVGEVYQLCDPDPMTVPAFVRTLGDAAGHRTVTLPATKGLTTAATRLLSRASVDVDPATLDYLDHPTRYRCPKTRAALAESDVEVPRFASYADRLVAFAREHPEIGDEPMV